MPEWSADARFTELVRTRRGELLRVALLITGNRSDAEDAVQDAVVAVSRAWDQVTPRGAYSYLRTAVVRKALDGRRHLPAPGDVPEVAVEDLGFLRLEEDRRFVELVQGLPPQQRAVLVLRFYNGLDIATIATTLEIGRPAVRSHLSRGLATLRTADLTRERQP